MYLYVYVLFCITNELRLASVSYFSLFCFCVFFSTCFSHETVLQTNISISTRLFMFEKLICKCVLYKCGRIPVQIQSFILIFGVLIFMGLVHVHIWGKNDAYNLTSKTCLLDVIFAQYSVFLGLCLLNHEQFFVPWKKLYSFT